jgi:hypothetical protein
MTCRIQISSFPSNICWRGCLFSVLCFGCLCQKKKKTGRQASCVDSYPSPLFCSTGLHACFCASTMLFLLLWLCGIPFRHQRLDCWLHSVEFICCEKLWIKQYPLVISFSYKKIKTHFGLAFTFMKENY